MPLIDDTKSYSVDGTVYDIPSDKSDAFLKKYPHAQQVKSYTVGKDTFDIPLEKVGSFLDKYPKAQPLKKKEGTDSSNGAPTGSENQPTGAKKLPSDITTNLFPTAIKNFLGKALPKQGDQTDKTPYEDAQQDAQTNLEYQDYLNQFYQANANPFQKPLARPDQVIPEADYNKMNYGNSVSQMRHAFLTDPSYLDPAARDKYYESLPKVITPEAKEQMKGMGEYYADQQRKFNFHRDNAVKNPTADNIAAMGNDQATAGDYTTATKTFSHLMQEYPKAPQGYQGMAYLSYLNGDVPKALDYIGQAEKNNPNDPGTLTLKAQYQWLKGDKDGALMTIGNAIHNSNFGTKASIGAYQVRGNFRHNMNDMTGSADDMGKAQQASYVYNGNTQDVYKGITPEIRSLYSQYVSEHSRLLKESEQSGGEIAKGTIGKDPVDLEKFTQFYHYNDIGNKKLPMEDIVAGANVFNYEQKANQYDVQHPSTGITGLITHPIDYMEQHANAIGQNYNKVLNGVGAVTSDIYNGQKSVKDIAVESLNEIVKPSIAGTFGVMALMSPTNFAVNLGFEGAGKTKLGKEFEEGIGRATKNVLTDLGTPEDLATSISDVANIAGQLYLFKKTSSLISESSAAFKSGLYPEFDVKDFIRNTQPDQPISETANADIVQHIELTGKSVNEGIIPKVIERDPEAEKILVAQDAIMNNKDLSSSQAATVANTLDNQSQADIEHNEASNKAIQELMSQKTKFYAPAEEQLPETITLGIQPKKSVTLGQALNETPHDVHTALLQYFSGNGKINTKYVSKEVAGETELQQLKDIHSDTAPHPDGIAEHIAEMLNRPMSHDIEEEVTKQIGDIIGSSKSQFHIQQQLRERIYGMQQESGPPTETQSFMVKMRGRNPSFYHTDGTPILKTTDPVLYNKLFSGYKSQYKGGKPTQIHVTRVSASPNTILPAQINNESFGDNQQARNTGSKVMPDGREITRQEEQPNTLSGKSTDIKFSHDITVKGKYVLVPKESIKGNTDENFLKDARPQNSVINDIYNSGKGEFTPAQLGLSDNAHTGAPIINGRHEIIQGHGRHAADLPVGYYEHLNEIAKHTGIKVPDDAQQKGLVLARKIDVNDHEAMILAQKTENDMVPEKLFDLMVYNMASLPSHAFDQLHDIMSGINLDDALEKNGVSALDWFVKNGLMDEHDANKLMVGNRTSLNRQGLIRLKELFRGVINKGMDEEFESDFAILPDRIKNAIDAATIKLMALGENAPTEHLQVAIQFMGGLKKEGQGLTADQYSQVKDEYFQRAYEYMDDRDWGMVALLNGLQYSSDLTGFLDIYRQAVEGDQANGIHAMVPEQALNYLMNIDAPVSDINSSEKFLNSLYETPKGTETTSTAKEAYVGYANPTDQGNTQGEPVNPNAGQAPVLTKDITDIIDRHIPDVNNITNSDNDLTDNVHIAGIAGKLGPFFQKWKEGHTALYFLDNQRDINYGTRTVDNNSMAKMYNDLMAKYPQFNNPELWKEADDYIDTIKYAPERIKELPPLSPVAMQLVALNKYMDEKGSAMLKVAKSVQAAPESFIDNPDDYQHREVLKYSDIGKALSKEMKDKLRGKSTTEMANTLLDFFVNEEKKGNSITTPDLTKDRKYLQAIDPQGNSHVMYLNDKDDNIYLWRDKKLMYDGQPVGRFNSTAKDRSLVNGTSEEMLSEGQFKTKDGATWKVKQALKRDIEQHAPVEYVNNPIYSQVKRIQAIQDVVRSSNLFNAIRNSKEVKPFVKVIDAKQFKEVNALKLDWENPLKRKEVNEKLKTILGKQYEEDIFDKYDYAPKGELPQQFDNTLIRNGALDRFKTAMQGVPNSSSKAGVKFLSLAVYQKLLGFVHPINIAEEGLTNMFNIDPLLYKNARWQYADLAWKMKPDGPATEQMMRAGLNVFDNNVNKAYTDFVKGMVSDYMANNKEFQQAIADMTKEETPLKTVARGEAELHKEMLDVINKSLEGLQDWEIRKPQNMITRNMVLRELGKVMDLKGVKDLDKDVDWTNPENQKAMEQAVNNYNLRGRNYKIPSHVIFPNKLGAQLSRIARNKNIALFAGYEYSKLRSLKNDAMSFAKLKAGASPDDMKRATSSALRFIARGLMLWGIYELWNHLNADKDEKEYSKTPLYGDLKDVDNVRKLIQSHLSIINGGKPTEEMSVSNFLKGTFVPSPILTDAVSIYNNEDFKGKPIYNPNGSTLNNAYDITMYMFGGGTVMNAVNHISHGDVKGLMDDTEKALAGISHTHFTPKQYQVVTNINYYNKHYREQFKDYSKMADAKSTESMTQATLKKWITDMQQSEKDLLTSDYIATKEILDGLDKGTYSPIVAAMSSNIQSQKAAASQHGMEYKGPQSAKEFWTKHKEELEQMMDNNAKEVAYTKKDALAKYRELEGLVRQIKGEVYVK